MSRTRTVTQEVKKYCKVCHDAGRTEAEYSSHFIRETRDPNSRVVCPTLLALECRFCYKKGHTVKYCKTLKNKDVLPQTIKRSKPQEIQKIQPTNTFACLEEEEEEVQEEEFEEEKIADEFPALNANIKNYAVKNYADKNYAEALAKPAPIIIPEDTITVAVVKAAPWATNGIMGQIRKSWADWSDSDGEDIIN
jgi:hypothetical protein